MLLICCLLIAIIAAFLEYLVLKKQHRVREIMVSGVFLACGVVLGVLDICHVKMPSPMSAIETIFRPLSNYVAEILS